MIDKLSDENIRNELYIEMMFMAGVMAYHGVNGSDVRDAIEKQIDFLVPIVKRYGKRKVRKFKESL